MPPHRGAFYAVRCFHVETASIGDAARGNAGAGRMRVQWWRDVVHGIYSEEDGDRSGDSNHGLVGVPDGVARPWPQSGARRGVPSGYPVVSCLADAVGAHGLSRRWLDKALDARARDLDVSQPATVGDLERYCDHAHASLLLLALECLAPGGGGGGGPFVNSRLALY